MNIRILCVAFACCSACASASSRPAPAPAVPTIITYTINVPSGPIAAQLNGQFPNGVALSPVEAQQAYDFTSTYGTPNVYAGVQAPQQGTVTTGIVVAPLAAASKRTFTAADWPGVCLGTCTWLGRFAYAQPQEP